MIDLLRGLVGLSPRRPATRLTEADALGLARKALPAGASGAGLIVTGVQRNGPSLRWIVSTATVGSGTTMSVDDATGQVTEVTAWGLR